MAGLTLAQAEQHLSEWLSADSAVAKGQAYSLGGRTFHSRRRAGDPRKHPLLAADGEAAGARWWATSIPTARSTPTTPAVMENTSPKALEQRGRPEGPLLQSFSFAPSAVAAFFA